jgi:hypothetical protein
VHNHAAAKVNVDSWRGDAQTIGTKPEELPHRKGAFIVEVSG